MVPFYAHLVSPGIRNVTWVTPVFRYAHDITGWESDLFPLLFVGRKRDASHLVVPPILWDFQTPHSDVTVLAPFYVNIADSDATTRFVLNSYYREKKVEGGVDWEYHFFPVFAGGHNPSGSWWNVLYGFVGYTEEGRASHMRVLWIPIPLKE